MRTVGKNILGVAPQVQCVGDGDDAVKALEKRQYALVLMDIHMPRMGGVQATREIRKRCGQKNTLTPFAASYDHIYGHRRVLLVCICPRAPASRLQLRPFLRPIYSHTAASCRGRHSAKGNCMVTSLVCDHQYFLMIFFNKYSRTDTPPPRARLIHHRTQGHPLQPPLPGLSRVSQHRLASSRWTPSSGKGRSALRFPMSSLCPTT